MGMTAWAWIACGAFISVIISTWISQKARNILSYSASIGKESALLSKGKLVRHWTHVHNSRPKKQFMTV